MKLVLEEPQRRNAIGPLLQQCITVPVGGTLLESMETAKSSEHWSDRGLVSTFYWLDTCLAA